jgi:hypothetical protein
MSDHQKGGREEAAVDVVEPHRPTGRCGSTPLKEQDDADDDLDAQDYLQGRQQVPVPVMWWFVAKERVEGPQSEE